MHLVFSLSNGASVWLGGGDASGDLNTLMQNKISAILAGAAYPRPAQDPSIADLGTFDGTGLVEGTVSLEQLLKTFRSILRLLITGGSVLLSCRNGAHRAATLCALLLMWLTGEDADVCSQYLTLLRSIVDLESHHPSAKRNPLAQTPLEWLRGVHRQVQEDRRQCELELGVLQGMHLNELLEPKAWEQRLALGFARAEAGEAGGVTCLRIAALNWNENSGPIYFYIYRSHDVLQRFFWYPCLPVNRPLSLLQSWPFLLQKCCQMLKQIIKIGSFLF